MESRLGMRERALISLWCGASLAAFAAWLVLHGWAMTRQDPMPIWAPALAASMTGVAAGIAAWVICRGECATLSWNRGAWRLTGVGPGVSATPGSLELMLDLGPWVLLRFRTDDRRVCRWLGVGESVAGPRWHALRAALHWPVRSREVPTGPAADPAP
jgi:hypothetical protein